MGSGRNGWTFFSLNKLTKNKQKQKRNQNRCVVRSKIYEFVKINDLYRFKVLGPISSES